MLVGAEAAQRESGLPVSLMQTIQALIVVFVVAGDALAARVRPRRGDVVALALRGDAGAPAVFGRRHCERQRPAGPERPRDARVLERRARRRRAAGRLGRHGGDRRDDQRARRCAQPRPRRGDAARRLRRLRRLVRVGIAVGRADLRGLAAGAVVGAAFAALVVLAARRSGRRRARAHAVRHRLHGVPQPRAVRRRQQPATDAAARPTSRSRCSSDIPLVGEALFAQNLVVYVAVGPRRRRGARDCGAATGASSSTPPARRPRPPTPPGTR